MAGKKWLVLGALAALGFSAIVVGKAMAQYAGTGINPYVPTAAPAVAPPAPNVRPPVRDPLRPPTRSPFVP